MPVVQVLLLVSLIYCAPLYLVHSTEIFTLLLILFYSIQPPHLSLSLQYCHELVLLMSGILKAS